MTPYGYLVPDLELVETSHLTIRLVLCFSFPFELSCLSLGLSPSTSESTTSPMLVSTTAFALSWAVGTLAVALPLSSSSAGPLVTLDYGTFLGKTAASNGQQVSSFLGVPFARPPINDLRYRLAV